METTFKKELENLINSHSKENGSDTPDFILAEFLNKCLQAFDATVNRREAWCGRKTMPIQANVDCVEADHKVHGLKTWMPQFQNILDEIKTFDYRANDRGFELGDLLQLKEWDQDSDTYTGREVYVKIIYMVKGGVFGIPEGYCIMSVKKIEE